ncbi:MAG: hypothetical protein ACSHXI_20685 [Hoeflea sp.]|uniref:hypothetical protein n=1 Tax=Hoeflea sp. TaxID=1940281 RepID=UPI003EF7E8CD
MAVVDAQFLVDFLGDTLGALALDISLVDGLNGDILHLNSDFPNQLVLTISNNTSKDINIGAISGAPSLSQYDFAIRFTNNTFYFGSDPEISVASSTWTLDLKKDSSGYVSEIFLGTSTALTLKAKGTAGDSLSVALTYSDAAAASSAVAVDANINISKHVSSAGTPIPGMVSEQLTLLQDAGIPTPLAVVVSGPRTVLNDGTTPQDVRLRLINTSAEPVVFSAPVSGGKSTSQLRIVLPLSDQSSSYWALSTTSEAKNIDLSVPPSVKADWTITSSSDADQKEFILEPVYSKNAKIAGNSVLELTLSGVSSSLAPGFADVIVELSNFPIFGTQAKVVQIEKSPLVYNNAVHTGLTSAGTSGAGTGLSFTGDSSSNMLYVEQTGAGPSAFLKGGGGLVVKDMAGASPGISVVGITKGRGIYVDNSGTEDGLYIRMVAPTNTATGVTIDQSGDGLAAHFIGGTGVLVEKPKTGSNGITVKGLDTGQAISVENGGTGDGISIDMSDAANTASGLAVKQSGKGKAASFAGGAGVSVENVGGSSNGLDVKMASSATGHSGEFSGGAGLMTDILNVSGSSNMFGTVKKLDTGTYTANSDGFAIGYVAKPAKVTGMDAANIFGETDGLAVSATGGHIVDYMASGMRSCTTISNTNSFMMPVKKGSSFSLSIGRWKTNGILVDAPPISFFWVPIGTSSTLTAVKTADIDPVVDDMAELKFDVPEREIAILGNTMHDVFGELAKPDDLDRLVQSIVGVISPAGGGYDDR